MPRSSGAGRTRRRAHRGSCADAVPGVLEIRAHLEAQHAAVHREGALGTGSRRYLRVSAIDPAGAGFHQHPSAERAFAALVRQRRHADPEQLYSAIIRDEPLRLASRRNLLETVLVMKPTEDPFRSHTVTVRDAMPL